MNGYFYIAPLDTVLFNILPPYLSWYLFNNHFNKWIWWEDNKKDSGKKSSNFSSENNKITVVIYGAFFICQLCSHQFVFITALWIGTIIILILELAKLTFADFHATYLFNKFLLRAWSFGSHE